MKERWRCTDVDEVIEKYNCDLGKVLEKCKSLWELDHMIVLFVCCRHFIEDIN